MDRVKIIQVVTARHYRLTHEQLMSQTRLIYVARPRQIAMYLARKITKKSLPDLGKRFGGRHHTTILWAWERIEQMLASDASLRWEIERISEKALDVIALFEPAHIPVAAAESLAA